MTDIIAQFDSTPGAWMIEFDDGWWAYLCDELPLGPFPTQTEAAEAAARARWFKPG